MRVPQNISAMFLILLLSMFEPSRAISFTTCEFAAELAKPEYSITFWQIPTWVCIAETASNISTKAIHDEPYHGIFRLHSSWCSRCGLSSCDLLEDDNIADDIECAVHVYKSHHGENDGFHGWGSWFLSCRNPWELLQETSCSMEPKDSTSNRRTSNDTELVLHKSKDTEHVQNSTEHTKGSSSNYEEAQRAVVWKVNITSLKSLVYGDYRESHAITTRNEDGTLHLWKIRIYPNGSHIKGAAGLYLINPTSEPQRMKWCQLFIENAKNPELTVTHNVEGDYIAEPHNGWGKKNIKGTEELFSTESGYVVSGHYLVIGVRWNISVSSVFVEDELRIESEIPKPTWQDYSRVETLSDVTLIVNGTFYKTSKMILSAYSKAFRKMLLPTEENNATTTALHLDAIGPDTVRDMLEFMYTGSVTGLTREKAQKLIKCAEDFEVMGLKECTIPFFFKM